MALSIKYVRAITTFVLLVSFLFGTCQEYEFSRLTEEDGLPGNYTQSFLKDNQGFMWIGTANGLCRYDGNELIPFTQEQGYTISSDHITELLQDSDGIIWIGTDTGGLNSFDPKTNTFESYIHDPSNPHSIAADRIQSIVHGDENTLWIGFDNGGGLSMMEKKTKKFINYDPFGPLNLPGVKAIRDLAYDKKHNKLWLGTTNGLISFDLQTEKFQLINHPLSPSGQDGFFALEQIDENRLIAGFFHAGVDIYYIDKDEWEGAFSDPNEGIRIFNLSRKSSTEYWVAARRKGLAIFDLKANKLAFVPSDIEKQKTPFPGFTQEVYADGNGVWIGSRLGVSYSYPRTNPFIFNPLSFSDPENDRVLDMSGKYDKIYIVGFGNRIWEIDKLTGEKVIYTVPSTVLAISGILEMEDRMYLICNRTRIIVFDKKTKTTSEIPLEWGSTYVSISAIRATQNDKAIITCRWGGAYTMDLISHEIVQTNSSISLDQWQNDALIQENGTIWIGSSEGVIKYHPQNDSVSYYQVESIKSKKQKHIHRVVNDPKGNTWLGTSHGLIKIDGGKETLFNVLNSNIPGNLIYDIEFDNENNMWIRTQKGVCRIDLSSMEVIRFDQSDGISAEGILFAIDGEVFYGVEGGYFNLSRRVESSIKEKPKVHLTNFQLKGNPVQLDSAIDFSNQLTLEYWDNSFSFSFTSPNFSKPDKIKFAYRLVGLDDKWTIDQSKRRYANYTNLDGGNYQFEVKAGTREGKWGEVKRISLNLDSPYWETWWFYSLCGLLISTFAFTFYKTRINILQQRADQEAQELRLEAFQKRLMDLNASPPDLSLDFEEVNSKLTTPLSKREFEVLQMSLDGKTNAEIAEQLFISLSTVKFHLRNTYSKLGVSNRKEALVYVVKKS